MAELQQFQCDVVCLFDGVWTTHAGSFPSSTSLFETKFFAACYVMVSTLSTLN